MNPYGAEHRRWIRTTPKPEGDPCPRCGMPMWPDMALDAGHVQNVAHGGADGPRRWEHRRCNQRAGASLGGKMRRRNRTARSRQW